MAVQLVNLSGGKFEVNPEAVRVLQSLDDHYDRVYVISIVGSYRRGKSFLLNKIAGSDFDRSTLPAMSGDAPPPLPSWPSSAAASASAAAADARPFATSDTTTACTHGIWMYALHCNPAAVRLMGGAVAAAAAKPADGTAAADPAGRTLVLLLDTEGLASMERSESEDDRIYSLAMLISSLFMFNIFARLDESSVQQLSIVANISKIVQSRATSGSDGSSSSSAAAALPPAEAEQMPAFWCIIRDASLQLPEGKTATQYLNDQIAPRPGAGSSGADAVRRVLTSSFTERACFMLPKPFDADPTEPLKQEFLQKLAALRRMLLLGVRPKTVRGMLVRPAMLAVLVQSYVSAFNSNSVPSIASGFENMVAAQGRKALDVAVTEFTQALSGEFGAPARCRIRLDADHHRRRC
jgi:hypothetical protein